MYIVITNVYLFNPIYYKVLDCDWFSVHFLAHNWYGITWLFHYRMLVPNDTFCVGVIGYRGNAHIT